MKILDFGLARRVVAHFVGNDGVARWRGRARPVTCHPSRRSATSLDGRSDLFSLGVVLFEMLSGTRPYNAGGPRWFDAVFVLLTKTPDYSRLGL